MTSDELGGGYMDFAALIMAGGLGSRMGYVDKGALRLCGRYTAEWVLSSIIQAGARIIISAVSPRNPMTLRIMLSSGVDVLMMSGSSYVKDLSVALSSIRHRPLLVAPIDTPLIPPWIIRDFVERGVRAGRPVVNMAGPRGYVGISLFNGDSGEWIDIAYDSPLVLDIDTPSDLTMAEALCRDLTIGVK